MEGICKTETKCFVGAGSYFPTLCWRRNLQIDLPLWKTWSLMAKRETTVVNSLGEISYNVSNASVYLATNKGSDLK